MQSQSGTDLLSVAAIDENETYINFIEVRQDTWASFQYEHNQQ